MDINRNIFQLTLQEIAAEADRLFTAFRQLKQATSNRTLSPEEEARLKLLWDEWGTYKSRQAWLEDQEAIQARQAQQMHTAANLGERFSNRTFSTFDASRSQEAYDLCFKYADSDKTLREGISLLLYGDVGVGKSHLAAAISNRLLDRGLTVLFNTYTGHLNRLKAEFTSTEERTYLNQMKQAQLLIIDDLGKEKPSSWANSVLFDVVNTRYEHLLPLVITTNYNLDELEKVLDSALFSRLCEVCRAIHVEGSDYRRLT